MSGVTPERLAQARAGLDRLEAGIRTIYIGQDDLLRDVLTGLVAGGHLLLEGSPGLGKTLLVKTLAGCLGLTFRRIQFTPDLMPADITGGPSLMKGPDGSNTLQFRPGPVFTNVLLADEINRGTPKTQSALLEAMAEGSVTVAGSRRRLDLPFFVLATQNPIEMEGTYPLPEAQLDRFMFKLSVPFPGREVLKSIGDQTTRNTTAEPEQVLSQSALLDIQNVVTELHTPEPAFDFAARLVLATHPERDEAPPIVRSAVRFGASPRAMQALIRAGRARALMAGRKHVSTDDIRAIAPLVLTHRVVLSFEAQLDRISAPDIVAAILQNHRS
ncbi:MAG: AAA family ATPase [Deltaproteobacteria bacterium]|nr:AAA family ATPase [Deltaproteobacteria bacterium]